MTCPRATPKNNVCDEEQVERTVPPCDGFSVCLPLGKRLYSNGLCVMVEDADVPTPDGIYDRFLVKDGCIVAALPGEIPQYTPPPCAPAPAPCIGGGEGGTVSLSPDPCNLTRLDASGNLITNVNVEGNQYITWQGCGTANNPLTATVIFPDSETHIGTSTPSAIEVVGTGSSTTPYRINLRESGIVPGTYAGFTFNQFGQVTAFNPVAVTGIQSIVNGPGIDVAVNEGVATISIPSVFENPGDYLLGGYKATIDLTGRITRLSQQIIIDEGLYDVEDYLVELNHLGSVTSITSAGKAQKNIFSQIYTFPQLERTLTVNLTRVGRVRITYRSGTVPAAPGVVPYVGDLLITFDNTQFAAYAANGALEILTAPYSPGEYEINISDLQGNMLTDVAILDVVLVAPI